MWILHSYLFNVYIARGKHQQRRAAIRMNFSFELATVVPDTYWIDMRELEIIEARVEFAVLLRMTTEDNNVQNWK